MQLEETVYRKQQCINNKLLQEPYLVMQTVLLHCPVARELWNFILNVFRISQFCQDLSRTCFSVGPCTDVEGKVVCGMLFHWVYAGVLEEWRERNRRVFENVESSTPFLKESLLHTLFFWCSESIPSSAHSFVNFVNNIKINYACLIVYPQCTQDASPILTLMFI